MPSRHLRYSFAFDTARVSVIIPTYAPGELTFRLVQDLVRWNHGIEIYVVDDCTPRDFAGSVELFHKIAAVSPRVTVLRTPVNKLKAGALNYALKHIEAGEHMPEAVLTLDDDVVIEETTVRNLVTELMSYEHLGAVCSKCRVFNKNTNLLTRLQGLEYLGFNAIRLADEGFFRGPLVMHGMLTAFRASALREAGGFSEGHLIEDYEVTTRLKARGWSVKSALNAPAWTVVPETLPRFWRQRTRWAYGGITVVAQATHPTSVFQDLLGHGVFIAMLFVVGILFLSHSSEYVPPFIAQWVIALSFLQLLIWYSFQLWLMRFYREKDIYDWIIRATLLPEFVYSYVMTFALLGSYLFHSFIVIKRIATRMGGSLAERLFGGSTEFFRACGYAERNWGTRAQRKGV